MIERRRCDGCAYWRQQLIEPQRVCHHTESNTETADDWWCEHWWPAEEPLPEPWEDRRVILELNRAAIASHRAAAWLHAFWEAAAARPEKRGPCGMRWHAPDCDCGGAGGDR